MAEETWLQAVPNFSFGRSRGAVRRALRDLPPAVLDTHSDRDHDRTVVTAYAPVGELFEAIWRLVERALPEVDLRAQRGVHPRVGAVDVVPFVPVLDATIAAARAAAADFAAAFAARYRIPTFLYGEASPQARSLPALRRGGLPGLARRMARGLRPDFGPPEPHPRWGVTLVGAREVLVAFNVDLPPGELDAATGYARELRTSGGGLPALRALGLALRDAARSQLSMNFLDHHQTCPSAVMAALRSRGAPVTRGEVVGLLPQAVWDRAARDALALDTPLAAPGLLEPRLRRRRVEAAWRRLEGRVPAELRGELRDLLALALGPRPEGLPWREDPGDP